MRELTPGSAGLKAGDLARQVGISKDTLRHYERMGVLPRPARGANGYRYYPADAVERVLLVRAALAVGFTLAELAPVLASRDRGGAPCRQVRELAARKLEALERQIVELGALREALVAVIGDWDARLAATPPGRRARLLDNLAERLKEARRTASLPGRAPTPDRPRVPTPPRPTRRRRT